MYGWHGKLLRIDLTNQKTSIEEIDPQVSKDFIGGRGVAIRYLYDEVDPGVDPLSPQNKLIFATGPLTATTAPTGNRYMVVTKSPLTGAARSLQRGRPFPDMDEAHRLRSFHLRGQGGEARLFVGE